MRRGTVRTRAAVGATSVVAVALLLVGVMVVSLLRSELAGDARLQAEARAREVAAQVTDVNAGKVGGLEELDTDDPIQVVDVRGRVIGASEPLRGQPALADFHRPDRPEPTESGEPTASPEGDSDQDDSEDDSDRDDSEENDDRDDSADDNGSDDSPAPTDSPPSTPTVDRDSESEVVRLPVDGDGEVTHARDADGEQDFTLTAVQSATRDGEPVTVYAGASLRDQESAVSTVTRAMLFGLPVLLAVVGVVTWLVTRRALRPVEGIRREMAAITASTDLSRRVPEPAAQDEVGRLARTTNETLTALESSVERQRRFVADASHELRSPIASLRTQLEVGAAHPELLDLDDAVTDTVRLQVLAADLLLLARLDAGEKPGDARVDLSATVREELAQRTGDRLPVAADLSDGVEVTGSRGQLARVLGNLLDNAQRHADSRVTVSVRRVGKWASLEVADDGAGVPEPDRERIFSRFVRLDDARSRDEGGAGLGLAIARDVAERHGGSLRLVSGAGGARFELRLPLA